MRRIKKIFVQSSAIEALGYYAPEKILRVWFTTGKIYDYYDVTLTEFENLKAAASIGEYYNYHIRKYNYQKVK